MGKLFEHATKRETLFRAWYKIRANGVSSKSAETRSAIEHFERQANSNIHNIQRRLRSNEFEFEPQKGVLKTKKSGGKRGIVLASVHNRVVERAWLDTLQEKSEYIRQVNETTTSVGGVPDRSVPHGLKLIDDAFKAGFMHFVRSDISGFFDNIPRFGVIKTISSHVDDDKFLETLISATAVTLSNEKALGEERHVFPTDTEGVAQGSPLSPLFGNILLHDFDLEFNQRDIICVRFIDDFVLLARSQRNAEKAFSAAKCVLASLGLQCHDPFLGKTDSEKASRGHAEDGFIFLGYDIRPGLYQPSKKVRDSICRAVDDHLRFGRRSIIEVVRANNSFEDKFRYVQTLNTVDLVLRGWGEAFAYGNAPSTLEHLDAEIDGKLNRFRSWFARFLKETDWKTRRRAGGVCLLGDIRPKTFDDVPLKLPAGKRFASSPRTIVISTDGSVITGGRRRGKDQGPGGWAILVHETGEQRSGRLSSATNNRMELRAVIEALRHADGSRPIRIRTDSQYVHDTVEKGTVVKSNQDMWREYLELAKGHRVRVEWVKGHSGDEHNELVDKLARAEAMKAQAESGDGVLAQSNGADRLPG